MELITTTMGLLTLIPLGFMFFFFASRSPLGALSLPSVTAMTSAIYFYVMPAVSLASGDDRFLGMRLTSLEWVHAVVLLYILGALAAFLVFRRAFLINPAAPRPDEGRLNGLSLGFLWVLTIAMIVSQVELGRLNLLGSRNYELNADTSGQLSFLGEGYNLLVPLTLIFLIRRNFSLPSLLLLAPVLFVLAQAGFRFRIMILLAAVTVAFLLLRRIRIRASLIFLGATAGLFLVNLLGSVRRYGEGIDLSGLQDVQWRTFFSSFGGEIGIVYVTSYVAGSPLPDLALFQPWLVGFARLVPSFLWPDKPMPDYLSPIIGGFTAAGVERAGIAPPQQVEMLLQFGWLGVPMLAFLYFAIATLLIGRLSRLSREARLAGIAIAPAFFGYYMQSRGYFFQIFADSLFFFAPCFLVSSRRARRAAPPSPSGARTGMVLSPDRSRVPLR